MRVQVFQHVPFEALGAIEPWLAARDAQIGWTRFFEDPRIPAPDAYDWLIVMGGPMSANDEAALPWLRDEKRAIAAAIDAGKTVLGVCLGAQLIASALGANVTPNREREIGWFPIERVADPAAHPIARAFPARAEVFHWHGETFDLPPCAVHLARSEACDDAGVCARTARRGLTVSSRDDARRRCRSRAPLPRRSPRGSLRTVERPDAP